MHDQMSYVSLLSFSIYFAEMFANSNHKLASLVPSFPLSLVSSVSTTVSSAKLAGPQTLTQSSGRQCDYKRVCLCRLSLSPFTFHLTGALTEALPGDSLVAAVVMLSKR